MKTLIFSTILIAFLALSKAASGAPVRRHAATRSHQTSAKPAAKKPASSEVAYFTDLLSRADTAPITDFLHLWFPDDVHEVRASYLDTCVDIKHSRMILSSTGNIAPECGPDVLYSWGPVEKLNQLRQELTDDGDWNKEINGGRTVWATISPISTYSYGPVEIRFKFKKGTPYIHGLNSSEPAVAEDTDGLMDFLIDNGSIIESWSFGTPEQYDEIVKDISHFMTSTDVVTYTGYGFSQPGLENVYHAGVAEREAQNEATLRDRLTTMIRLILSGKGEIHYAKGVVHSREQHFATDHPTYFNER